MWILRRPKQRVSLNLRGCLASLGLIAICTALIYLLQVNSISVHAEILYILAIIATAIYFGLFISILTSILSVLVYDYFFVPPLYTLGPRNTDDIPMLVMFLLIGFIVSFLGTKLIESEEKFRSMVETANEGIAMLNPEGVITYVNKRFPEMLGYSPDEILGKFIMSFVDKDYAGELQRRLDNRKRGIGESYELAYRRKGGSIFWVKISASPLFAINGKFIGSVGMHSDITEEKNLREQLDNYAKRLIRIQEEERKRIARELHDDTAPTLAYLSLELDSIMVKSPNLSEENFRRLQELREKINHTQENIRRFSHELHPSILDNLGLEPALEALVSDLNSKGKPYIEFNVGGTARNLSDDIKLTLYRITQEALNNIWKHSRSTAASVNLDYAPNKVVLRITDNGQGFDISKPTKSGLGLTGMRERAYIIGAHLNIDSEPGRGTTITTEVQL